MQEVKEITKKILSSPRQTSQKTSISDRYTEETRTAVAGLLAVMKENWSSFLHGKGEKEVNVTRKYWLSQLGSFSDDKIVMAADQLAESFPGEWPPNVTQVRRLLVDLSRAKGERQWKQKLLPLPAARQEVIDENLAKMKSVLGINTTRS